MTLRPRLVPAVIVAATVLLGVKVSDIFTGDIAVVARAQAPAQDPPATGAPLDLTKLANEATKPPPAPKPPPAQPRPASLAPAAVPTPAKARATTQLAAETPPADSGAPSAPAPPPPEAIKDPLMLSPSEIVVLQELSKRRATLDQRASEIDEQSVVLQATEKRIDQKIAELQQLQKSIQGTVDKQNAADDARLQNLAKIYAAMKPADAAQILEQLNMPILLGVLEQMKVAKTAPILAAMTPAKAEAITTALAQRHNPPAAAANGAPPHP